MNAVAQAKYIRLSPRKMQVLVRSIKTLSPDVALSRLKFINKSGSLELAKVIKSALDNDKKVTSFDLGHVRFRAIDILPGSAMKRFQPVSRGMAHEYKKRMTHVKVILTDELKDKKSEIKSQN